MENMMIVLIGLIALCAVFGSAEGLYQLGTWAYKKHQERKQMNRLLVKGAMCKMEKSA